MTEPEPSTKFARNQRTISFSNIETVTVAVALLLAMAGVLAQVVPIFLLTGGIASPYLAVIPAISWLSAIALAICVPLLMYRMLEGRIRSPFSLALPCGIVFTALVFFVVVIADAALADGVLTSFQMRAFGVLAVGIAASVYVAAKVIASVR